MAAMVGLRFHHPKAACLLPVFAQKLVTANFSGGSRVRVITSPPPNTDHHQLVSTTTTPYRRRKSTSQYSATAPPPPPNPILSSSSSSSKDFPFSGLEDVMMGYFLGTKKATEVAHSIWKKFVQKGDTLVDATCGNGYDTLAMVKIVSQTSPGGHVYAMDIQQSALDSTSSLLDETLNSNERQLVELFATCHSNMEDVVPKSSPVRLVAFNLGYLPGGDKTMITRSETTLKAMEAAARVLAQGGLISLVVYVGHPGGREEFDAVEAFASKLPVEDWICCKLQMLNRPLAPVLVLLFKR